tara:strand:+ start:555 stop:1061 length:507 start_codon:yes stop_codon:yes gene_type:complete
MEDIRKIVRKCIQESFWTEKEWDMHLGKEKSKNNPSYSKLKNDIKEYVESENFQLQNSVFFIMNLAKKANPGDSEYDLIDTLKGFILDLEGEDEHMDDKFRNRFKKVYEDFDYMFEKINEVVSAASDSDTDNQMLDPGVSAVANTPTDDENINENKKSKFITALSSGF